MLHIVFFSFRIKGRLKKLCIIKTTLNIYSLGICFQISHVYWIYVGYMVHDIIFFQRRSDLLTITEMERAETYRMQRAAYEAQIKASQAQEIQIQETIIVLAHPHMQIHRPFPIQRKFLSITNFTHLPIWIYFGGKKKALHLHRVLLIMPILKLM